MTRSRGQKLRLGIGLTWLILCLVSFGVRRTRAPFPPPPGTELVDAAIQTADGPGEGHTRWIYTDVGPKDKPVVLLLHGSPGNLEHFSEVAPLLTKSFRVITPDLVGFGALGERIPDYSARAHARYLIDWLETQSLGPVHAVGFSMGSAVSLHIWELAPEHLASFTMVGALGVVELELLGDHTLNHALHGAQWGIAHLVDWLLPHFGGVAAIPKGLAYTGNFFHTDQRLLRPLLERMDVPTQIIHGEHDVLVPLAAAKEHARIVPQAELIVLEDQNHFLPWTAPEKLAELVHDFAQSVEAGKGISRTAAEPARLAQARQDFDPKSVPPAAGFALALLVGLLAVSTLVSEDLTCLAAGWLVAQGRMAFLPAVLGCFLGILIGDLLLYGVGRWLGRPALERRPLSRWVKPEALQSAAEWMDRRGVAVIFLSRFTPGLRLPTYLLAGALRTSFLAFAGFFALASALWTPILVGLSAWLGDRILPQDGNLSGALWKALPWILGLWLLLRFVILPSLSHYGRRRLLGRWKRLTEFEYWPIWAIYGPLLPYILWQALRHKSLTLFTAANPGIPGGGFAGESKSAILQAFGNDPHVARFLPFEGAASEGAADQEAILRNIEAWMAREGLDFPIVIKPDVGERGKDVRITREARCLPKVLADCQGPYLAQEFIGGAEFGVFYEFDPGRGTGKVTSITCKGLPEVMGDGRRTLGQLVLDDPRAVALAGAYHLGLGSRWVEVPSPGETVRLVDIGTHSRGSVFTNGEELNSPELIGAIESLSARFAPLPGTPDGVRGLCLGRYDIKAPSPADLTAGRNLKVIELNGVTSEPTHIYDARESLFGAWKTLALQWRTAYALGAKNRGRGARVDSIRDLLALWRKR